jgi:hypothetical protein
MALLSAICAFMAAPEGFRNKSLRPLVADLFDPGPGGYTAARMTYDLRRLRLKGLIQRVPGTHRYVLTPLGRRTAFFFTKTYTRVVRNAMARVTDRQAALLEIAARERIAGHPAWHEQIQEREGQLEAIGDEAALVGGGGPGRRGCVAGQRPASAEVRA